MQPAPEPGDPIGRIAGSISLAILALIYHADALSGWWLWDDPQLVLHALRTTPFEELFVPEKYLTLAAHTFTPLLTLSFDVDLAIAGAEPTAFYIHQLAMIALAAVLFFLLLCRFTDSLFAWLAGVMFVIAPPTLLAVRTLMIRHYVEGLVLALAAFLIWTRRTPRSDAATGVVYLLAMLAKEVYAPLPLFLLYQAWAAGDRGARLMRRAIPLVIAGIVFVSWRAWMLGSWGGFGTIAGARPLLRLPVEVWGEISGPQPIWAVLAILVLSLVVALFGRLPWRTFAFLVLGIIACGLPLVPLAGRFEPRYAFAVAVVYLGSLAIAARRSVLPGVVLPLAMTVILFGLYLGSRSEAIAFSDDVEAMLAEGRYIARGRPQAPALLARSSPEWYLAGIRDLRATEGDGAAPRYFMSEAPLVLGEWPARAVYAGRRGSPVLALLDRETLASIDRERALRDDSIAATVSMTRRDHALRWTMTPADGIFELLTHPGYTRYSVPPSGWRRIPEAPERQYFRIRRLLADGRWSITPVLPLPMEGETTRWAGGTTAPKR
jgi:hypothetical protein